MKNRSTLFEVKVYGSLELYSWTQNNYVDDNDASTQAKCIVFHHIIAHIA